ncbi:MAG: molecular chaperone HtpG [Bradymonadaceae bacterium]
MKEQDMSKETRAFEAEVSHVLRLMIHSMYSNKEVFLRELISNASDAIDKLRFEALSDESLYGGDTDLKIEVEIDKDERTITIRDNGIGMSREEVSENIGTIAKSGTKEFLSRLTGDQQQDSQLIGQFGVGFYSAFIVAERVVLTTRRAGSEEAVRWESTGEGEYTLEPVEKDSRGTEIVLHLREEEDEFLDRWRLESIIRKYSDHIPFPILLKDDEGAEEEPVNQASAIWTRARTDISEEEYKSFYKHVSHDFDDPLAWTHSQIEGRLRYTLLLYLPAHRPFDLMTSFEGKSHGIKLYVRRVFITDDAELFMPRYLRFVRGVVDSDDLPLNVSREMLQDNRMLGAMRRTAVKRTFGMLEDLLKDEEKYARFWTSFGSILKEGVVEDHERRSDIAPLLRFASTHGDDDTQNVSLGDYVTRMKEGQDTIYYITGDSYQAALNSPHLEVFRKKGVEVLLLWDRVDDWVMSHLDEFQGVSLKSVTAGDLDPGALGEEEPEEAQRLEEIAGEFKALADKIKEVLGTRIKDVRLSRRLTDSPACLVTEEGDLSGHMRRVLKASGQDVGEGQPIFEINPDHPLIARLKDEVEGERIDDWTQVLFEQAWLAEGGRLEDPASFVRRLNSLMLALLPLTPPHA